MDFFDTFEKLNKLNEAKLRGEIKYGVDIYGDDCHFYTKSDELGVDAMDLTVDDLFNSRKDAEDELEYILQAAFEYDKTYAGNELALAAWDCESEEELWDKFESGELLENHLIIVPFLVVGNKITRLYDDTFNKLKASGIITESKLVEDIDEDKKNRLQTLCDELNRKYGYRHNDRFTDSNSPYCGMNVWHTVTYEPTEMWFKVAWPTYDKIEVNFSYRNLSDEDGIRKSRRCLNNCDLNKYGLEITGDPEIEDSEKGWFDVIITLNTTTNESLTEATTTTGSGNYLVIMYDSDYEDCDIHRFTTKQEAQDYMKEQFYECRETLEDEGLSTGYIDDSAGYHSMTDTFDDDIGSFNTLYQAADDLYAYDYVDLSRGKYIIYELSTDSYTNWSEWEPSVAQFSNMQAAQKYLQDKFIENRGVIEEDNLAGYDEQVGYNAETNTFNDEITYFTTEGYNEEPEELDVTRYELMVF